MILKDNILKEIKKNAGCRRALMEIHNKSEYTILKWLRENSPELLKYPSLKVVAAFLGKDIDSMIIHQEHDFAPTQ